MSREAISAYSDSEKTDEGECKNSVDDVVVKYEFFEWRAGGWRKDKGIKELLLCHKMTPWLRWIQSVGMPHGSER